MEKVCFPFILSHYLFLQQKCQNCTMLKYSTPIKPPQISVQVLLEFKSFQKVLKTNQNLSSHQNLKYFFFDSVGGIPDLKPNCSNTNNSSNLPNMCRTFSFLLDSALACLSPRARGGFRTADKKYLSVSSLNGLFEKMSYI